MAGPSGQLRPGGTLTGISTRSSSRFAATATATAALLALALGACSSGDGSEKLVKEVNLTQADLGPEWTEAPRPDTVGEDGDDSRFAACMGRPDPKTERTADADSPEFRLDDRLRVMSSVQTMPSEGVAVADLAAAEGDRGLLCMRQRISGQLNRTAAAGEAPERFTVDRVTDLDVGDDTAAFRAELIFPPENGSPRTGYLDVVLVRSGKVEVAMTLFSAAEPFPADVERELLNKVVSRASASK